MTDDLPHRWRVTVRSAAGGFDRYHAVTWRGALKAVALAAIAHRDDRREFPFEVEVEDRGPVDRDERGVAMVLDADLTDRMEW